MMSKKQQLFSQAEAIIASTYLQAYWTAYKVNMEMVDEIILTEIHPNLHDLQTLDDALAFVQQKTGYSPYFIFTQSQITTLYQLFHEYLTTFILQH
jgi:hypothetical protein